MVAPLPPLPVAPGQPRLAGKRAVIVGAGQTPSAAGQAGLGNGRATAIRFAQEGARLLLVDRDPDSLAETAALAADAGAEVHTQVADITAEDDCAALVAAALDGLGGIDVLHNNVGIGTGDSSATRMDLAAWQRILDVNLTGCMLTCKHALPALRDGGGVITNISSVAAVCAVNIVAYKTSKAALNAYTHALATTNARHGVRANAILPGLMDTPMAIEGYAASGADRDELRRRRDAMVPLGQRMGDAWDVANAALFLASDEARFITGVCLAVDGGQAAKVG